MSCLKDGPGGPGGPWGPGGPLGPIPGSPWDTEKPVIGPTAPQVRLGRRGAPQSMHAHLLTLGTHVPRGPREALWPSVPLEDKGRAGGGAPSTGLHTQVLLPRVGTDRSRDPRGHGAQGVPRARARARGDGTDLRGPHLSCHEHRGGRPACHALVNVTVGTGDLCSMVVLSQLHTRGCVCACVTHSVAWVALSSNL